MSQVPSITQPKGYLESKERKDTGAHYTPIKMANFLARELINVFNSDNFPKSQKIKILDPAIGDGVLLKALSQELTSRQFMNVDATGFDIDQFALKAASNILDDGVILKHEDFLEHVLQNYIAPNSLFTYREENPEYYDLVITNPPYIRTQILGAAKSKNLSENFGLSGRVDIYHAFLMAISSVMNPGGLVGLIVSNRFMTTQAGSTARSMIREKFDILHVWDLGDTKMFEAAVLPALLLLRRKARNIPAPKSRMTSIYSVSKDNHQLELATREIFSSLHQDGIIRAEDGQSYEIHNGELNLGLNSSDTWRLSNEITDSWLTQVSEKTHCLFSDLGKIRVGIKTTADKVFIRDDWEVFPENEKPELLYPLITHHIADHYKVQQVVKHVLYTHEVINGKKIAINLAKYPKSQKYLEGYRSALEDRSYIHDAGRKWYEIWVPQDPEEWKQPKIVFRDISKKPYFWLDVDGAIVNGDCYWISCRNVSKELTYLALAVANSKFITLFYDRKFNNKLYAGRRRFITQYVNEFPIPDPSNLHSKEIVKSVELIINSDEPNKTVALQERVNELVWRAFDLPVEKVSW